MSRESEVWRQLGTVNDPELDESVTELRFVTAVAVSPAGAVDVTFRLPTYWCAANFAFLMAEDMRQAVASLPWVTEVRGGVDESVDPFESESMGRGGYVPSF